MIFFKFFILCIIVCYPKISFSATKHTHEIVKILCQSEAVINVNLNNAAFSQNIVGGYVTHIAALSLKSNFICDNYSGLGVDQAFLIGEVGAGLLPSYINKNFFKLNEYIDVLVSATPDSSYHKEGQALSGDGALPYIYVSNNNNFFPSAGVYTNKPFSLHNPVRIVRVTYKLRKPVIAGKISISGGGILAKIFSTFGNALGPANPILLVKTADVEFEFPNKCTIGAGQISGQSLNINFGNIDTTLPNVKGVYDKSIKVDFNCTGSIIDKTVLKMKITSDNIGEDTSVIATSMDGVSIKAYNNDILISPNNVFSVTSSSGVGSTLLKFSPSLNLKSYPKINGDFSSSAVLNFIFD